MPCSSSKNLIQEPEMRAVSQDSKKTQTDQVFWLGFLFLQPIAALAQLVERRIRNA